MEEKSSLGWNLKLNVECAGIAIDIAGGVAAVVATCLFARSTLNGFRLWNCFLVDYTHKKRRWRWNELSTKCGIHRSLGAFWLSMIFDPCIVFHRKICVSSWVNKSAGECECGEHLRISVENWLFGMKWKHDPDAEFFLLFEIYRKVFRWRMEKMRRSYRAHKLFVK